MKTINIIVDTSVIIKWLLPDEKNDIALKIKKNFSEKQLTVSIPHLTYYEIGNVLKTAVKRDRINESIAKKLYNALLDLEFVSYATKDLFKLAMSKSLSFDISFYDASYLALSEYLQIPFVTADRKLLNKVKNKFVVDLKKYNV
ncbi:MAG TPA: type II toxin-antitoxin system VapC family toxin [Patescibacteria group bacterium]